ncbi:MAG TPA: electron transport complex subunit RsxC [archaeon]|nr:electron transport complex subunit RsxC [archaeon]
MLKEATFKGGVHPPEFKSATRIKTIQALTIPSRVILHLQQHIGAPPEICVSAGDKVKVGTVIAKPSGFVSVPLQATISGSVKAISEALHPTGVKLPAIEIQGDGEDNWEDPPAQIRKYNELSPAELRDRIRDAGIVGLGGAAFPTHVKLSPPAGKTIDTFILNGAECEPYLTTDFRQMLERTKELIAGIKIILRILGCERVFIALERNKPEAIEALDRCCLDELNFEVVPLRTKYPQGGEKQLIEALTGRQVPSGGLPMDVGCLVHNVSTVLAIYDAVTTGMPLIDKVVTLAGTASANPGNYRVRVGTLVEDIITEIEGQVPDNLGKAIMGGPMMGIALPSLAVPVLKSTNGLVLLAEPISQSLHRPCIRCGSCIDSCPIRLMPCELALFAEHERWEKCREYYVKDCIECGTCSYTCPAGRNLVQLIRFAKYLIMSQDQKKKK